MRRALPHIAILVCLLALPACDPGIKSFDVKPAQVTCPGQVTLSWKADGDGLHLDADQPVVPALPAIVAKQGSRVEIVTATTTFTAYYPGAGHREQVVKVTGTCPGGGGGCGPQVMTFTGTCSAGGGPSYISVSLGAAAAPGNLTQLTSDADFPVHVQHAGADIALGAGGGPIFPPLPTVPASGSYTITVPGQVGINVCSGGGATRGGGEAPTVHITVTPTCPK